MNDNDLMLEKIHQNYRNSFADKLGEFKTTSELLSDRHGCEETIRKIERLAHKLSGSAGAYGYDKLSQYASMVQYLSKSTLEDQDKLPKLQQSIEALSNELQVLINTKT